jgi:hypothetical protein
MPSRQCSMTGTDRHMVNVLGARRWCEGCKMVLQGGIWSLKDALMKFPKLACREHRGSTAEHRHSWSFHVGVGFLRRDCQ